MDNIDLLLENVIKLNQKLDDIIEKQNSPWMTRQECADYLKISVRQVYKLTQMGRLKSKPLKTSDPNETGRTRKNQTVRIHREWADQYVMFGKTRLTSLERKQLNDLCYPERREW